VVTRRTSDERALWLGRHVLPHEASLRAWLATRAPAGLDVDDIIQETYTRLVAAERVDQIRDPRTYAFQTAKSVIVSHVRRARVVRIDCVPRLERIEEADHLASPELIAVDRDELSRLATAIAALPEPARTVFRLRRVQGVSQRDIAAQTGLTESAVEHLIGRALFALRRQFDRPARRRDEPLPAAGSLLLQKSGHAVEEARSSRV